MTVDFLLKVLCMSQGLWRLIGKLNFFYLPGKVFSCLSPFFIIFNANIYDDSPVDKSISWNTIIVKYYLFIKENKILMKSRLYKKPHLSPPPDGKNRFTQIKINKIFITIKQERVPRLLQD